MPLTFAISQPDLTDDQAIEIWNGPRFVTAHSWGSDLATTRPSRASPAPHREFGRLLRAKPDHTQMKTSSPAIARWRMRFGIKPKGRIDAFVQSVGPAGSIRGVGEAPRRHDARIRIVAVEPAESAVRSGGPTDAPKIDGIGAGFIVPLCRGGAGALIEPVSTQDATAMPFQLTRDEGLFAGTSTGANVVAALRLVEQLASPATIVTVVCDTGMISRPTEVS